MLTLHCDGSTQSEPALLTPSDPSSCLAISVLVLTSHCPACFSHRLTPYFCPRSQQKITIVGAHLEPETPEEEPLFLGVFKPKDGIREKLRETLHNVLMEEMAERSKDVGDETGPSTDAPDNTVTISKNTR